MAKVSGLEQQLEAIGNQRMGALAEDLAAKPESVGETNLVIADVGNVSGNELRQIALGVRDRIHGSSLVILGSSDGGKGALVAVASRDLVDRGVSAGELLTGPAGKLGGGGSRDPELAQAGGPNGSELARALDAAREESGRALAEL
jgi:alanyl-tRNA synthetase